MQRTGHDDHDSSESRRAQPARHCDNLTCYKSERQPLNQSRHETADTIWGPALTPSNRQHRVQRTQYWSAFYRRDCASYPE